ncbi:unnamed protein product [Brassicogethes aeneus]|uniref:Uncharacterized protein n=1 Tax=Brassicogethes aeneus TaxID=1431903 RepID=A0A9P0BEL0_BRAAE|nr:unnamed protein product [Brassicogethes aeneus]
MSAKKLVTFIVLVYFAKYTFTKLLPINHMRTKLGSIFSSIRSSFTDWNMCLYVGRNSYRFNNENVCPYMVLDKQLNKLNGTYWPLINFAFAFLDKPDDINKTLSTLLSTTIWNPRQKTIFIISETPKDFPVANFMKFLWSYNLIKFIVIIGYEDFHIYTYNMFADNKVINLKVNEVGEYFTKTNLNFNLHPLNAILFNYKPSLFKVGNQWKGTDYGIYLTYVKMLNASVHLLECDFFDTAFDNIKHGVGDIVIVSHFRTNRINNFDISLPTAMDKLVLLIPRTDAVNFEYFWNEENYYFCLGIMIVFMCVVVVLKLMKCEHTVLTAWRILFQSSVPQLDHINGKLKWFLGLWIITSLIMSNVFSSTLSSSLLAPKYKSKLNTIREIVSLNVTIRVLPYYKKLVPEELELEPLLVADNTFTGQEVTPNNYYLMRQDMAEYYQDTVFGPDGDPYFYILDEAVTYGFQFYIFQKNSPYLNIINKIMQYEKEFVLSRPFLNKNNYEQKNKNLKSRKFTFTTELLMLLNLYGFWVLVFIGEIIAFKYKLY